MKPRVTPACRRRAPHSGGFTLIEVIITLFVFSVLAASVFAIMVAVFASSNNLQDNQNRHDEISALRAYLKNSFAALGAEDHLVSYRRGDGDGLHVNGIELSTQGDLFALDASHQPNGLYGLRFARPPVPAEQDPPPTMQSFGQQLERDQSALTWVAMIHDIHSIKWRFQSSASPDWADDWTLDSKPSLIEFSIQLAGDDQPVIMDFLIPHVVAPNSQPLAAPVVAHGP